MHSNTTTKQSLTTEDAILFFKEIEEIAASNFAIHAKYAILCDIFKRIVSQSLSQTSINFIGLFAKVDYLMKQLDVPTDTAQLIHNTRRTLNTIQTTSEEQLSAVFPQDIKATALLVELLSGTDAPTSLTSYFATTDHLSRWSKLNANVLRCIVDNWDDEYIYATEEESASEIKICYSEKNHYLWLDAKAEWSYLKQILHKDAQLNLVRIRIEEDIYMPELIIYEPDYLIDITAIASCFETYAESPYVYIVNLLKPQPNTIPIHLGNLAGQFLDETIHNRQTSFNDSVVKFFHNNAIALTACNDLKNRQMVERFYNDARQQLRNIAKLIGEVLPQEVEEYDEHAVVLEPTFFSEVLGIQGRLDLLHEKNGCITIIEQKSGKGAFNPQQSSLNRPEPQEKHLVQLSLYRALFNYEFGKRAEQLRHFMLLYSKYSDGLVSIANMPQLTLRAIRMRNLLAWLNINCANEGYDILQSITPTMLNRKGISGRLWEEWVRPELERTLNPIREALPLERAYYLRFLRFISKEHLLSKIGNKTKDDSGFAAAWLDTLEDKRAAGNIYEDLTIESFGTDGDAVESLRLKFSSARSIDTSNFRIGDIVILYPYRQGEVPNACAQMVNRASISKITEMGVEVQLRNSQTDRRVLTFAEDVRWAIEHDLFESSVKSLYSGMHSFLSAQQERRDLILCQRKPTVDESIELSGNYGAFTPLVLHAKQARDIFLVIGPPGTGKTSFALLNILKEELTSPNTNVLLLSYTNRAVDEICSKLVESNINFLRIGSELNCEKAFRAHLLCNRAKDCVNTRAVAQLLSSTRVFCATTSALNANIHLLKIRHFDLAIIDESSQILEPHLIGLLSAHSSTNSIGRFVLIGDHKQLPAVVQQTPEESRVDEPELHAIHLTNCRLSLFERLLTSFKTSDGYDERYVYMLTRQGRMHQDIAEFPNNEFYGGKLSVVPLPHQTLPLYTDEPQKLNILQHPTPNNQHTTFSEAAHKRISFIASPHVINTTAMKTNQVEAKIIAAIVMQIYRDTAAHFNPIQTVGVIVPYRNQIATIRNAIEGPAKDITIDTVERYQGSQRDYIIYGFTVRQRYQLDFLTNNTFEEDGLHIDRKLNVAMTRARLHLIMVGNPDVLKYNQTFERLIDYLKHTGAYYDRPTEGVLPLNE